MKMVLKKISCILSLSFFAVLLCFSTAFAEDSRGNTKFSNFRIAKKVLERIIYVDHRVEFYCEAAFDEKKNITLPIGFSTPSYKNRMNRIECEHIVPAENFGRFFTEWREGANQCVDKKGTPYRGRKCAETNDQFATMEADLWNLVPAIGAVNAMRSNYKYTVLPENTPATFGMCPMKIQNKRAEPPVYTRGAIARSTLYMAWAYPETPFLSNQQRKLMEAWDAMYPPSEWECERGRRIAHYQGNMNPYVARVCGF